MGGPNSDECRTIYPMSNLTDYVESILGDRCQSDMIVIPTLIIYSTIFVLGLVGNICTCVVILSNKAMHNPTNFYLFSLAISDILVLVLGLPMELYQALDYAYPYTFGEYICKARAFLIEFTSYASIIIICCFSIERWLAICYPIRQKLFSTFSRAYLLILVAWVVSFVAALPMAFIVKINRLPLPDFARDQEWTHTISRDSQTVDRTDFCGMNNDEPEQQKRLIYFAFFAFFMIPALIIMLLYGHIAIKLRSADRYLQDEKPSNSERRSRSTGTVLKMLSYFYYSNSAINPILYNILSQKYRTAFCRTILGERLTKRIFPNWCERKVLLHGMSNEVTKCRVLAKIEFLMWDLSRQLVEMPTSTIIIKSSPDESLHQSKFRRTMGFKAACELSILSQIYTLLLTNTHVTKRSLYYDNKALFKEQRYADNALTNVCEVLGEGRLALNVISCGKESLLDSRILTHCDNVLVVEKDTVFQKLIDSSFHTILPKTLLVTGKGYPDICTRRFLSWLQSQLGVPIYGCFDADPHGILL
ncbi:hypothetical protein WR25_19652 [Diploscapter pachys]|uniref:G-protein coupled receptors family 1 profile domain-containing protein n=1 Tax=Diploscapter pachys TaxID=2018661 RepID=A0A2A2LTW0_9BILA|nr:hypothetical protein WR25_19652 [Diploscapter pachys]